MLRKKLKIISNWFCYKFENIILFIDSHSEFDFKFYFGYFIVFIFALLISFLI